MTLVTELMKEGKALLPTKASASICKCSYRTSMVGISSPTLYETTKKTEKHETRKLYQLEEVVKRR